MRPGPLPGVVIHKLVEAFQYSVTPLLPMLRLGRAVLAPCYWPSPTPTRRPDDSTTTHRRIVASTGYVGICRATPPSSVCYSEMACCVTRCGAAAAGSLRGAAPGHAVHVIRIDFSNRCTENDCNCAKFLSRYTVGTSVTETERRKGGAKLSRSETVSVRLDPKLRYLAELAARRQRRSLSSYIEWAIEDSLKHCALDLNSGQVVADEAEALWDVDEADRFARLALRHPELLTHDEQVLWKLVRDNGYVWRGRYASDREWTWTVNEGSLIFKRLREHWDTFKMVADFGVGDLPTWAKTKPSAAKSEKTGFEDMDDDIPF